VISPTEKPKAPFPPAEAAELDGARLAQLIGSAKSKGFFEWCWDLFSFILNRIITYIFLILGGLAARLATIFMQVKDAGDPAYNALAEVAIKDLLDVDVRIGSTNVASAAAQHAQAVKNIGEGILKAMFGDYTGASPKNLEPSAGAAEKFASIMTRLSFEGWMSGWLMELIGVGQLEKFGELDDKLAQTLGLGRLSRRVLAPPLSILIETPFTWLLNRTYRPSLLGSAELIRQYLRGTCTRERLFYELSLAGFKDGDIEGLLATHQQFFSVGELLLLNEWEVWDDGECVQHLRDQGYSEDMAKAAMQLARSQKIDAYKRQQAAVAGAAFEARDIEEQQFRRVLDDLGLPDYERDWIFRTWGLRREFKVKDLTLSDVEAAVKRGILSINDYRALCLKLGYSLADARTLELLLMTEITDKAAAEKAKLELAKLKAEEKARKAEEQAARRAAIEAELAVREISLAQMEALVRRGLRSIEQYREFLRGLKYTAEDISALAELLEGQIDDARADEERRKELAAEAAKRKISLGDLERAVGLGLMSVDEYRSQLAAAGFGDEDRSLLARMLQAELDLARENEARKAEARAALAERKISLDDLERAVRLGQRSVDQYRARLVAEGFSADDADLMAELLRADVAADQVARERRAEIDARLKKKKISLADLERAVRASVSSISDYRNVLLREGYSDQDAELLVRLLQLQVDADRQAAEKRAEAEKRLAEKQISLSDVERAVKLGVLDLAAYKRVLTREGFSAEDQGILVQALTAELAQIRAAERKRAAAEKAAAKRQISLPDLERAVRLGLRTMVEYQGVLADLGYGPQDQATLVALLELAVAQDRAARLKREQAETELVQRGLSLSQWERSVLEGIRGMAEYRAWLREQGYGEEDAETLVALLELQLEEQAAREQAKTV
jgi:hypothetical protein